MVELLYALDPSSRMAHVSSVANGIDCRCVCPCCHAPLVAKNNGEIVSPHFAHASDFACSGAHESELHLLAKEIISSEKSVMLPQYGSLYPGGRVIFDIVEVEQRNDISILQPDLCGVIHRASANESEKDSRLWIEIMVTHAIGPEKRAMIKQRGIACIEINLSKFMFRQTTREELAEFLLNDRASREWTNNPKLERKRLSVVVEQRENSKKKNNNFFNSMDIEEAKSIALTEKDEYLHLHRDCCAVAYSSCFKCKHHTTRQALLAEAKRLHLPAWTKEALAGNLLYYTHDNIHETVTHNKCYAIHYDSYMHLLPTSSPDIFGRPVTRREILQNESAIHFFQNTVPAVIASEGMWCHHCARIISLSPSKREAICSMPNVVHKHRRG